MEYIKTILIFIVLFFGVTFSNLLALNCSEDESLNEWTQGKKENNGKGVKCPNHERIGDPYRYFEYKAWCTSYNANKKGNSKHNYIGKIVPTSDVNAAGFSLGGLKSRLIGELESDFSGVVGGVNSGDGNIQGFYDSCQSYANGIPLDKDDLDKVNASYSNYDSSVFQSYLDDKYKDIDKTRNEGIETARKTAGDNIANLYEQNRMQHNVDKTNAQISSVRGDDPNTGARQKSMMEQIDQLENNLEDPNIDDITKSNLRTTRDELKRKLKQEDDQAFLQGALDRATNSSDGIDPYTGRRAESLSKSLQREKKRLGKETTKIAKKSSKDLEKAVKKERKEEQKAIKQFADDAYDDKKDRISEAREKAKQEAEGSYKEDLRAGMSVKEAKKKRKERKRQARIDAREAKKEAKAERLTALGRNHKEEGENVDQPKVYQISPDIVDNEFCQNVRFKKGDMKAAAELSGGNFIQEFDSSDPRTCKILYGDKLYSKMSKHPDFIDKISMPLNSNDKLGRRICAIVHQEYCHSDSDARQEITNSRVKAEEDLKKVEKEIANIEHNIQVTNYQDFTPPYNKIHADHWHTCGNTPGRANCEADATRMTISGANLDYEEQKIQKRVHEEEIVQANTRLEEVGDGPSCEKQAVADIYNKAVTSCSAAWALYQEHGGKAGGNGGFGGGGNDRGNVNKDEEGGPSGGGPSMIASWDGKYQCVWTETAADWKSCKRMISTYNTIFAGEQAMNTMHMVEGTKFQNNKSKEVRGETEKMQNGEGGDLQSKSLDISKESVELAAKQEERKMWVSTGAVAALGGFLVSWVTPRNIRDNCEKYLDDCSNAGQQIEAHDQHYFPNFHMRGKFMMAIAEYGSKALASMLLKNQLKDQAKAIGQFKDDLNTLKDDDGQELMVTQCQVDPHHPNCRMDTGQMVKHSAYNPHGDRAFSNGGSHQNFDAKPVGETGGGQLGDYLDDKENYDADTLGKIGDVLGDGGGKKTGQGNRAPPPAKVSAGSPGGGGGGGGGGASAQGTGGNFSAKGVADAKGGKDQNKLDVNRFERGKSKKGSKFGYNGGYNSSRSGRKGKRGDRRNPLDAFMGRKPAAKNGGSKVMNFGKGSISQDRDSSIFARIKKRYHQAYESDRLLTHR
ncbi:hypothetical protein N9N67_07710 [Bacteriovoracaceae bacterium]|nr:hypothetical protein [Bacteriovoracaceae bacterium]